MTSPIRDLLNRLDEIDQRLTADEHQDPDQRAAMEELELA